MRGRNCLLEMGREPLGKRRYRIPVKKMETLSIKNIKMIANWCSKQCK